MNKFFRLIILSSILVCGINEVYARTCGAYTRVRVDHNILGCIGLTNEPSCIGLGVNQWNLIQQGGNELFASALVAYWGKTKRDVGNICKVEYNFNKPDLLFKHGSNTFYFNDFTVDKRYGNAPTEVHLLDSENFVKITNFLDKAHCVLATGNDDFYLHAEDGSSHGWYNQYVTVRVV